MMYNNENNLSNKPVKNNEIIENFHSHFLQRRDSSRLMVNDLPIEIEVEINDNNENKSIIAAGKIIDLGQQGIQASLDKSIPISSKVNFKIHLPHPYKIIHGKGRISWISEKSKNTFYYGIIFLKFEQENDTNLLKEYITNNSSPDRKIDERRGGQRRSNNLNATEDKRKIERRLTKGIFKKCIKFTRIKNYMLQNHYFYLREICSASDTKILVKGKEMINLGSNNYLGLTTHPKVKEAAIKAIEKYGTGSGGVRMLSGTMDLHNQLENKLAKFMVQEDCIVFSTGYTTNVGVITALLNKDDVAIIDEKSHASIIDGCNLSQTEILVFEHNNINDLKKKLEKHDHKKNKLIITDGIFSMDGNIAKLDEIYNLAQKYNVAIMIDDAHATGIIGENGKGTAEYFNLVGKIDITIGTLSKALGGIGGFMVGNKDIIHFLKHTSRPFIFSASFPPSVSAALIAGIEIIEDDPSIRKQLWENIKYMKESLKEMGYNTGNSESAIIPIIIGDENKTYKMVDMLEKENIFVSPVAYPAVKKKESRLRVSIMAAHTSSELEKALKSIKKAGQKLEII